MVISQRLTEAARSARVIQRISQKRKDVSPLARTMEAHLGAMFRQQGKLFVAGLKTYGHLFKESYRLQEDNEADASILFDSVLRQTVTVWRNAIYGAISAALTKGGEAAIAQIGFALSFKLDNPLAVQYLENDVVNRISGINTESFNRIKDVLITAGKEGWSYNRAAKELTGRFEQFAAGQPQEHISSRAHLIAVTELGDAYEQGSLIAARQMKAVGLAVEKSWLTVGDNRVDPDKCRANSAQGWIDLESPFQSGHTRPLAHPACRCTALYQRKQ